MSAGSDNLREMLKYSFAMLPLLYIVEQKEPREKHKCFHFISTHWLKKQGGEEMVLSGINIDWVTHNQAGATVLFSCNSAMMGFPGHCFGEIRI